MTRYGMLIDVTRCVGCAACRLACQTSNQLPPDVSFIHFETREYGTFPNVSAEVVPVQCQHCEDAPCQSVCPTGATYTTDSGVVLVDEGKCIGCKYCVVACPYGARVVRSDGVVDKCRFCWNGDGPGDPPACVATCVSEARVFGDLDDPDGEIAREIARRGAKPLSGDLTEAKIFYVR